MTRTLRDLLRDAYTLQSDLRDAGCFAAAGEMNNVIEAVRNREAYDTENEGEKND